mmetsp:Transcript_10576/g.19263  ORF Transcript_10576/g.19263 Transcript_10576/m.19263 type:complete len:186 (-) Transcript_10576:214-771(-)
MIEWNGEKLIKLCGKVKLERRLFPPDPNRPDLPPSRPPGPTTPNTGGGTLPAISPFGGTSLSNILDNDVYDHHISAFDSDHGAGPDSQDYMHKTQSAVRASPAKKQVLSREGAGAASRSSYRDALSFLRSVYKLDDDANPYYHGFSAEMEHQFIITWETMGDVGGTFSRIVCQEMGVGAFLGQMK